MKKTTKIYLFISIALLVLFCAFTAVVALVDVQPIGPCGSEVGLATLNGAFFTGVGTSTLFYNIAEIGGIICLLYPLFFAALGFSQLVKRRSLLKVDYSILLLGAFYVAVAVAYVAFDALPLNYRPVLTDGVLEASYPSTHTMLAICFTSTALIQLTRTISGRKKLYRAIYIIACSVAVVTVVSRALSGVHWLTDIIGGVLFSALLVFAYLTALSIIDEIKNKKI